MTAGTKAILLLSVFGLVVLVACYGDGPSSSQADKTISGRSTDPLLASASEISSPRRQMSERPSRPARTSPPATTRPPAAISAPVTLTRSAAARSVKVIVPDAPAGPPTFTMGAARTRGILAPPPARDSSASRAGSGVGRSAASTASGTSRPSAKATDKPLGMVTVHIIKPGDTLGHIAQKYYGSARKWSRIADANSDIDVDALRVGQEIKIPARVVSPSTDRSIAKKALPRLSGGTHTIDEGETLSSIAEIHLGDQAQWYRLYTLNQERIGSSPDRLVVGMVIAIPD